MADKKISALTAATTPLAGTEVLPIVQSGSTVKVANNDLRPKQIQSNATSGVLQVVGPAAAATRVMTVPDANFTAARTDAAQSFTGDQTLSNGNLVQGTAAKGVNFIANTPATGMTSQLLNWYEEGVWTPTLTTTGVDFTSVTYNSLVSGSYVRIGKLVHIQGIMYTDGVNVGSASGDVLIGGLPFTSKTDASGKSDGYSSVTLGYSGLFNVNAPDSGFVKSNSTVIALTYKATANGNSANLAPSDIANGGNLVRFAGTYVAA